MQLTNWWERRWFLAFLIVVSTAPLLWPQTPPLVDVPGHLGRFRVQLDLDHSKYLQSYFEFHWALIGNLGVDLLVELLAPVFGLEPAVKLIVIAIPPLTVFGLIWIAREIHGHIPPTIMFAIPFIYGYPFNFGFINFSLSIALALIAFGYWLHLTNAGKFRLRAFLFVLISCLTWLVHAFGWGVLGLLVLSSELVKQFDAKDGWKLTIARVSRAVLPLGVPLLLMLAWRTGTVGGETDKFFNIHGKVFSLVATLRDRWLIWDSFGVGVAIVIIGASIFDHRLARSRKLTIPAGILAVAFLIMPERVFGSAYADMRLAPLMFIVAILAVRARHENANAWLAALGLIFLLLRIGGNTVSFAIADWDARRWLTALDYIPRGSAVASLTGDYCGDRWALQRHTHLGSFVIVRREGFSNDQWQAAGAQLLRVRYPQAAPFTDDRSTFIYSEKCIDDWQRLVDLPLPNDHSPKEALRTIPRDAFAFIWMIDPPDYKMRARPGLSPVWRTRDAVLYRIDKTHVVPYQRSIADRSYTRD